MKSILTIVLSFLLVVSGSAQTRNVVVGTNDVIVSPTNFWNANAVSGRSGLGLGSAATNPASAFQPSSSTLTNLAAGDGGSLTNLAASNVVGTLSISRGGTGATNASGARSSLGLSWSGLTNTNASSFQEALFGTGTNPVLVDTGGNVLSPANFWSQAPIQTLVQNFTNVVANSTNTLVGARNIYAYSLATNVSGITNVLILPTNGTTFNGDNATIIHRGTTNTATVIRQAGSTNNLISINQFDEAIKFTYENNAWTFYHNISYVEPIKFSGTNASANRSASVTNLFTPNTPLVFTTNGQVVANIGTNVLSFSAGSGMSIANSNNNVNLTVNENGLSFSTGPAGAILVLPTDDTVQLGGVWNDSSVRSSLGFSTNLNALWTATNASNARAAIGLGATNDVTFRTAAVQAVYFSGDSIIYSDGDEYLHFTNDVVAAWRPLAFNNTTNAAITRTNLGLGATWLTNTNVTNFRTAIGLGTTNNVSFSNITASGTLSSTGVVTFVTNLNVGGAINVTNKAETRTNLGLPWSGLTNTNAEGFRADIGLDYTNDVFFGNTTVSNGTFYVFKTNVGPFEGLANLMASNNTTLSNETMLRVGLAEQTNRAAQFGFRVARTNNGGEGFATFSVFGYNALMMIGPSDRSRTNTETNAGIEADVYSISPTNKVMTLITTNTGATLFHRPIEFGNAANAGVTRTNLGLGETNNVTFSSVTSPNRFNLLSGGNGWSASGDSGSFNLSYVFGVFTGSVVSISSLGDLSLVSGAFGFSTNNTNGAANTRTNLGLGFTALTNTNIASFQRAIFVTNTTPASAANLADVKAWLEVSVVTNNVTNSFRLPLFQ